jgi:hypothetical protein
MPALLLLLLLLLQVPDEEWGRPLHDDTKLFELLILEGAQVRHTALGMHVCMAGLQHF